VASSQNIGTVASSQNIGTVASSLLEVLSVYYKLLLLAMSLYTATSIYTKWAV